MKTCILIPITTREVKRLSPLLAIWKYLGSNLEKEKKGSAALSLSLCITISGENSGEATKEVMRRLQIFRIHNLYREITVKQIEIGPLDDIYFAALPKNEDFVVPTLGIKSGPNIQFFRSMRQLMEFDYVLLNETDAFPQTDEWQKELLEVCLSNREKAIIGSRYQGSIELGSEIKDHLNGNAIYNLSHSLFGEGLFDQWEKALAGVCSLEPNTAYDILFAKLRNDSKYLDIIEYYPLLKKAIYQTAETSLICNASLPADANPAQIQRNISCGASILHGKHFLRSSLARCLESKYFLEKENVLARSRLFQDLNPSDRAWMLKKLGSTSERAFNSHSEEHIPTETPTNFVDEGREGISFFIKTYLPELEVAAFAITSIGKFCLEKHEIVVFTDNEDQKRKLSSLVSDMQTSHGRSPADISFLSLKQLGLQEREGYIDQQILKMTANVYCKYPLVLHVDSDSIFWRQFDAQDFLIEGKIILPYSDWGRDEFLPNDIVRKIQVYSGVETHDPDRITSLISALNAKLLEEFGIKDFCATNGCSSATLLSGEHIRWTSSYPDITWKCSSRIWGTFPYDTMRSHYMIRASSLKRCVKELEERFASSIWDVAYCRDTIPILSEFQIVGNWLLSCASPEEAGLYTPTHWHQLFSRHSSKIPMIKYNLKDYPMNDFLRINDGEFSSVRSKIEVLQLLNRPGWC